MKKKLLNRFFIFLVVNGFLFSYFKFIVQITIEPRTSIIFVILSFFIILFLSGKYLEEKSKLILSILGATALSFFTMFMSLLLIMYIDKTFILFDVGTSYDEVIFNSDNIDVRGKAIVLFVLALVSISFMIYRLLLFLTKKILKKSKATKLVIEIDKISGYYVQHREEILAYFTLILLLCGVIPILTETIVDSQDIKEQLNFNMFLFVIVLLVPYSDFLLKGAKLKRSKELKK